VSFFRFDRPTEKDLQPSFLIAGSLRIQPLGMHKKHGWVCERCEVGEPSTFGLAVVFCHFAVSKLEVLERKATEKND
jgi:hypothetical protein